jgi:signal transduction histidine kinase
MTGLPTLRRELVVAFAIVFAGALLVAVTGIMLVLPIIGSPASALAYVILLLTADVVVFALFGRYLIQRRLLNPIAGFIESAERIAGGEWLERVPDAGIETAELRRLADALNQMAERLIKGQEELAENIRSLDETNQLLTEARDAMVRSEKMASAGRLGAGIAHEVGNPLGAIIGYLALIGRHAQDPQKELVTAAEREAHRIDRIVRGLLDFSRPREAKSSVIDVNTVIGDTVDLISAQGRFSEIQLDVKVQEDLPKVTADHYQLQQVLVNLLVNAADALSNTPKPRIILRAHMRRSHGQAELPARRKDDPPTVNYSHRRRLWAAPAQRDPVPVGHPVVEVEVADNGPGIPADVLSQIFEPFVTTKEPGQGTGLGLAVSARLIEGMGGVIRANNNHGGGAVFTVVLPPADATTQTTVP